MPDSGERILPSEVEITVRWIEEGGRIHADTAWARIERLTLALLVKMPSGPRNGAWETLYRDRGDGRLWERTYPHGELQGYGPARLAFIDYNEAMRKYGLPGV